MSLMTLDYGMPYPFGGIIGKQRTLAWPVDAYRVTLPKPSDDGGSVNPFERVILKFVDATGPMTAEMLANETRIPIDSVKGILLRLRDKGLIDGHNAITDKAHGKLEGEADKVPVFVTAILFRELATGKILPFLHFVDEANPLRKKEDEEKSRPKSIPSDVCHKGHPPKPQDVITALRAMKKRQLVHGRDARMPAALQITIASPPESYYLQCPIAIQKTDGEYRIADPFGNGFSLILERAFGCLLEDDDQLAEWLHHWKNSLINSGPSKTHKPEEDTKQSFDNDANRQRFPKLVANLRPSRDRPFRSIAKIHASLEWALFYACSRRPYEATIATLRLSRQADHPALIWRTAQSLGLECSEGDFRPVLVGRLMNFEEGSNVDLDTVLPIAVLQAEKNADHPMRRIARSYPDFISQVLGIKKARDTKGHGEGSTDAPRAELPEDRFMREVVHGLLPEIVFSDAPAAKGDEDGHGDSLLEACASIQGEFGFKLFNRLGANIQDRLIHAERFWLATKDRDEDDASTFAYDLYAALQATFARQLLGRLPPDLDDSRLVGNARAIARDHNLGGLPECLTTVRPLVIRQTLQGSSQSLGACVIAFLLMADDESLHILADSHPSFITDVSRIITSRGHGNEPLPLQREEIAKLRKAAFSIIKTLTET
jgi:hypothetical protein